MMRFSSFALLALAPANVDAYTAGGALSFSANRRACAATMFEEFRPKPDLDAALTKITRSRESRVKDSKQAGRVVVTDGSDSFFKSRKMIQTLHDFGTFGEITAFSSSVADAKKMLLSRQSRYSGLNDALDFAEGELSSAMEGAGAWLAINADEAQLPGQIEAAKAAGVSRVFILLSADGPTASLADVPAIESLLKSAGMVYTILRTGDLIDAPAEVGLKLDDIDMPVCEAVAKDDVYRFVTEALTLADAGNRLFSLCPSVGTAGSLRQMRYAGYERREEVEALLAGKLVDEVAAASLSAEEEEEAAEVLMRSSAEVAAEREEELKMLLERARVRAEEQQARLAYEEAEKAAHRKEQERYYSSPLPEDIANGSDKTPKDDGTPKDEDSK